MSPKYPSLNEVGRESNMEGLEGKENRKDEHLKTKTALTSFIGSVLETRRGR